MYASESSDLCLAQLRRRSLQGLHVLSNFCMYGFLEKYDWGLMSHCSHSNFYRTYCMVSCMLGQHRYYNLYLRCQTWKCIAWSVYRRLFWALDLCRHVWPSLSGRIILQTQGLLEDIRTLVWFAYRCKCLQFSYLRCIDLRLCYAEGLWRLKYLRTRSKILFPY